MTEQSGPGVVEQARNRGQNGWVDIDHAATTGVGGCVHDRHSIRCLPVPNRQKMRQKCPHKINDLSRIKAMTMVATSLILSAA
jgi:hypothetical protein